MVRTTAGQGWQRRIVSADQCFLLIAPPTLDLSFRGHGVFDALEDFVENQSYRSSERGEAIEGAGPMLPDPLF